MTFFEAYHKYKALMPSVDEWVVHRCCLDDLDGVCHHPITCREYWCQIVEFDKATFRQRGWRWQYKSPIAQMKGYDWRCLVCDEYSPTEPVSVWKKNERLLGLILERADDEER